MLNICIVLLWRIFHSILSLIKKNFLSRAFSPHPHQPHRLPVSLLFPFFPFPWYILKWTSGGELYFLFPGESNGKDYLLAKNAILLYRAGCWSPRHQGVRQLRDMAGQGIWMIGTSVLKSRRWYQGAISKDCCAVRWAASLWDGDCLPLRHQTGGSKPPRGKRKAGEAQRPCLQPCLCCAGSHLEGQIPVECFDVD